MILKYEVLFTLQTLAVEDIFTGRLLKLFLNGNYIRNLREKTKLMLFALEYVWLDDAASKLSI